jgi:D-alanine-D-alanine ligase
VPGFLCPAEVEPFLAEKLQSLAIRAHLAVGAVDVSRVDIRLDADGNPRLLEINTLPGLTPGFSDLCVIANAEGTRYQDVILEILDLGASRFGLLLEHGQEAVKPLRVPALMHMLPAMATMMLN